ncbi:MAG: ABC transporter ATP-binding protein [Planctomycetota bacterium]|jgi:putative ABC transport system ATP-binding protein
MIEARDLRRTYIMGGETIHALDGVSLTIEDGDRVAIIGPSGSGKSTLMHLLGGLDTPDGGTVLVDGVDLSTLTSDELAAYRNAKVGFVFQSFHLQAHLTAVENVELPLKIRGVAKRERRAAATKRLTEVGLADRLNHRPTELSGGQRQRVSIARALASDPRFLLADEPTGNLDTKTGKGILDLFLRLNQEHGLTVIVVTHDHRVADALGRSVGLLDGRVVGDDSKTTSSESTDPSPGPPQTGQPTPEVQHAGQ